MNRPSVLVVDAGLGNIGSVTSAFERQSCSIQRLQVPPSSDSRTEFSHLVLPGVGSFSYGMDSLRKQGWADWLLNHWIPSGRPLLGICLGMQLLATRGSETASTASGSTDGLNLIPGSVDRFQTESRLPLPHVGWNSIDWSSSTNPIAKGLPSEGDFYFVHSYVFSVANSLHCLATADYGGLFTAVVANGNCFGVQFHPEKSQRLGRQLLKNFLELG